MNFSPFLTKVLTDSRYKEGCGMSTRPAFYSGRGATTSDLDSESLWRIQQAIRSNRGEEAAKAFVQMVADMKCLSATDFLITLYAFEQNEYKWDASLASENGTHIESEADVYATFFGAIGGSNRPDQTHSIRADFLFRNGVRTKVRNPYGKYNYRDAHFYGEDRNDYER